MQYRLIIRYEQAGESRSDECDLDTFDEAARLAALTDADFIIHDRDGSAILACRISGFEYTNGPRLRLMEESDAV